MIPTDMAINRIMFSNYVVFTKNHRFNNGILFELNPWNAQKMTYFSGVLLINRHRAHLSHRFGYFHSNLINCHFYITLENFGCIETSTIIVWSQYFQWCLKYYSTLPSIFPICSWIANRFEQSRFWQINLSLWIVLPLFVMVYTIYYILC